MSGSITRHTRFLAVFMATLLVALVLVEQARAQVEIDITEGRPRPTPIALPDFLGGAPETQQVGTEMTQVITNNLQRSGLFAPVNPSAFIERTTAFDGAPNFDNWRVINSEALVTGRITAEPDGRIKVEFRLWDVFAGQQMLGQQYFTEPQNWRRVAHIISDAIYQRITGEAGYFDTRIVFVDETGPKDNRQKRLAIMDQDGFNVRYLTNGTDLVLTPRFSPTNQEVTYMSYQGAQPRVFLLNIETGQREVVGDFPGMTFAPRFSPEGQRVIMSLQQGGNANIYAMDLRSRQTVRLTNSPSIDTGPSYAPDGRRIVFESDRSGSQQIYVMNSDGSGVTRISQGEGRYSTPVWSPRGDLIAFTKQLQGRFLIGVMRPDGSGERILTEGYHNEGPTWAPNGRVVMFFRDIPGATGGPQLWSVDLTGYNELRVPTPSFGSDPAWSPMLN